MRIKLRGGTTLFKDSSIIAQKLLDTHPSLSSAVIDYYRTYDPTNPSKSWPLISKYKNQDVLTYRANTPFLSGLVQHVIHRPDIFIDDAHMYSIINQEIDLTPLMHSHDWERGDLLLFNNRNIIHTRTAYTGKRFVDRKRFNFL